jgi:phosphoglycerate dehydrogenase-like enzyme
MAMRRIVPLVSESVERNAGRVGIDTLRRMIRLPLASVRGVLPNALRVLLVVGVIPGAIGSISACSATPPVSSGGATREETIGSSRGARIAIPTASSRELVYFARRPLEAAELEAIAKAAPNLRIESGLSQEEAVARASEAHGADASYGSDAFLAQATNLRWLQATSAGVERFITPALRSREEVVLTNFRSVHGPAIAEHAMALLLALTRDLPAAIDAQRDGRWERERGTRRTALDGRTMLVVGLGGIGSEIAKRGHAFGMRVIATRRSDAPKPSFVDRVERPDALHALLGEADVVIIAAPLTAETEGLFDHSAFAAMREGSYLINIARGQIIVTDAMLASLHNGRLAGVGLDVTDPEPLPADHPLWREPRVIITPHVAGDAEITRTRGAALYRENLRRFARGEPLLNTVDIEAGY